MKTKPIRAVARIRFVRPWTFAARILAKMPIGKPISHIEIARAVGVSMSRTVAEMNRMVKNGHIVCLSRAVNRAGVGIYERPNVSDQTRRAQD